MDIERDQWEASWFKEEGSAMVGNRDIERSEYQDYEISSKPWRYSKPCCFTDSLEYSTDATEAVPVISILPNQDIGCRLDRAFPSLFGTIRSRGQTTTLISFHLHI